MPTATPKQHISVKKRSVLTNFDCHVLLWCCCCHQQETLTCVQEEAGEESGRSPEGGQHQPNKGPNRMQRGVRKGGLDGVNKTSARGQKHTCGQMTTGELFSSPTPHEGSKLTPDLIVKHEGPVFRLWGGVGEPEGAPTAGYDAQLLHLGNTLTAAQRPCCCVLHMPTYGGSQHKEQAVQWAKSKRPACWCEASEFSRLTVSCSQETRWSKTAAG